MQHACERVSQYYIQVRRFEYWLKCAPHYFHHEDNEDEDGDGLRSILDVNNVILSRNITIQDPSILIMTLMMNMTMTIMIFMMLNLM